MSFFQADNIFTRLVSNWSAPGFTLKDREIFYRNLVSAQLPLGANEYNNCYTELVPWLDPEDGIKQEILAWYQDNGYQLFHVYLFSLLALNALMKLKSALAENKADTCNILRQAVFRAAGEPPVPRQGGGADILLVIVSDKNTDLQEKILRVLKGTAANPKRPGTLSLVFDLMCNLAGLNPVAPEGMLNVSVSTLLLYKKRSGEPSGGVTAALVLEAIPGRFGGIYPALEFGRKVTLGTDFLYSLDDVISYLKDELGVWPDGYDVRWWITPDDEDITLENTILSGGSLGAAYALGLLQLFARIVQRDRPFPLQDELKAMNLKTVAITATSDNKGRLGRVGGIWQKLLEAARINISYVVVAADQQVSMTPKLILITARNIVEAVEKLVEETGSKKIKARIYNYLLKYATETKKLEICCNTAFTGDDLTRIKAAIRFTDKPVVYVEDLLEICFTYGYIKKRHPLALLLEKIAEKAPPAGLDEIRQLCIMLENSLENTSPQTGKAAESCATSSIPLPELKLQRINIKKGIKRILHKNVNPLKTSGNPYVNRVMIPHPDLFFGRDKIIRWLEKRICALRPQSVSFIGERRIGKSSLMNYLTFLEGDRGYLDDPEKYIFLYIDFQGLISIDESHFTHVIFSEIKKKFSGGIEFNLKGTAGDLRFLCEELTKTGFKLIFLFDEFEAITRNTFFGPAFYSLLRSLANSYAVAFITSSVKNLKELCHTREISCSPFFNIFATRQIGLFSRPEAEALITGPSARCGVPLGPLCDRIIAESGLHPFFLQIMCCAWFDFCNSTDTGPDGWLTNKTPPEVLLNFREESRPHFEYSYDTLREDERRILISLAKGVPGEPESYTAEILARKGYLAYSKSGTLEIYSGEFKRFITQYTNH